MKLWHDSFAKIQAKTKTIEMRLLDEKRSAIQVGDVIAFQDVSNADTLECVVTALFPYPSFEALYQNHGKVSIGYDAEEAADPADMLAYYSPEAIRKYGVLGIEIRVM